MVNILSVGASISGWRASRRLPWTGCGRRRCERGYWQTVYEHLMGDELALRRIIRSACRSCCSPSRLRVIDSRLPSAADVGKVFFFFKKGTRLLFCVFLISLCVLVLIQLTVTIVKLFSWKSSLKASLKITQISVGILTAYLSSRMMWWQRESFVMKHCSLLLMTTQSALMILCTVFILDNVLVHSGRVRCQDEPRCPANKTSSCVSAMSRKWLLSSFLKMFHCIVTMPSSFFSPLPSRAK